MWKAKTICIIVIVAVLGISLFGTTSIAQQQTPAQDHAVNSGSVSDRVFGIIDKVSYQVPIYLPGSDRLRWQGNSFTPEMPGVYRSAGIDFGGPFRWQSPTHMSRSIASRGHRAAEPSFVVDRQDSDDQPNVHQDDLVRSVSYQEAEENPGKEKEGDGEHSPGTHWFIGESFLVPGTGFFPVDNQQIDRLRVAEIESTLARLRQQVEETNETEPTTVEALNLIQQWHETSTKDLDQIDVYRNESSQAPQQVADLQQKMSEPLPEVPGNLDAQIPLAQHETQLQGIRDHAERLSGRLNSAQQKIQERRSRPEELAEDEVRFNESLEQVTATIQAHTFSGLQSEVSLLEKEAKLVSYQIHLRLITETRKWLDATEKSAFMERDWIKRQLDHTEKSMQRYAELVARLNDELVARVAEKARAEALLADPLLKEIAEQVAELAEQRNEISKTNRQLTIDQTELDDKLKDVKETSQKLREYIEAAGDNQTNGLLLRYERTRLPATSLARIKIAEIQATLPELRLNQLRQNEQLDELPLQRAQIEQTIGDSDGRNSLVTRQELLNRANKLLAQKTDFLYELKAEYETHLKALVELQTGNQRLLKETDLLRSYIDEHVLWIRSAEPIGARDFSDSIAAVRSIGHSDQWQAIVGFLSSKLKGRWLLIAGLSLGLLLGFGMRKHLDHRLRKACLRTSEIRMSPLVRALSLTILQACMLPVLIGAVGLLLSSAFESGTLRDSISHGLLAITPELFVASFIYRMAIRGGLAESQLGWSCNVCRIMRTATGAITRYGLPLIAVTYALEIYQDGRWISSLGRLAFIGSMSVLALASFRLLRGIGKEWKSDPNSAGSIWEQTFALWSPLIVLAPLSLVVVSALGYMYSSVFLGTRLLNTWWLILGTVAFYYIARRLVEIGHNIVEARRRWRGLRSSRPQSNRPGKRIIPAAANVEKENRNTRLQVLRLLHITSVTACLMLAFAWWQDAVPAFKAFDYGLWQTNRQMVGIGPDKKEFVDTKLMWVTVGDVLRSMMILAATFVFSRNIPGLLQMVVLDRLPLDRGGKYAITIVCRYAMATLGIVLACRSVGFTWTSVQWLVAAMSVGLGFGLQEIFANFVAGIIILLERPIRVGDYVTVNGTNGFVTRIQLRATMIVDFDRRELIVPNKKFITDDVINWTLSDPITREVVKVGIAYGSDTRLAQSVLLRVARENPDVLKDPRPEVVMTSFGASSLDFELRIHVPNRTTFHDILHQLHIAIDREFRAKGIEIAFPQQDIHVKGVGLVSGENVVRDSASQDGNEADQNRRKAG